MTGGSVSLIMAVGDERLPLVPKEPEDKYNAAFIIFLVLGTGMLLPWNAYINAEDYFGNIFSFFPDFMFFLVLANNYSSTLLIYPVTTILPRVSFGRRIVPAFCIYFIILLLAPLLIIWFEPHLAMYLTYVCIFLTGLTVSVLSSALFGLAALFPRRCLAAVMSGNGMAGVLSSLLRIFTKLSEPNTPKGLRSSSLIFFEIGTGIIFICILCYFALMQLPITKYYLHKFHTEKKMMHKNIQSQPKAGVSIVFKKSWREFTLVLLSFFVTLTLFPGITERILPSSTNIDEEWFCIILTAIFTVGDFIGRTLPRWFVLCSTKTLPIPILLRFSFLGLFPLCIKPELIKIEYVIYILMALFSLSNGYFNTLGMMFGTTHVQVHEKEVAGIVMSLALNLGIFLGSHAALLMLYLLTGSIGLKL